MTPIPPLTVFDVETTGLDPCKGHRIIEIAGVRVENAKIGEQTYVSFVNPNRSIPFEAQRINWIADTDVADAPLIDTVLPQFLAFSQGSILVAHNATFDLGFLESEKEYCWGYVDLPEVLCTMRLSQGLYPREFRHNLDVLVRKFALPPSENRHRALADTMLAAQALLKMLSEGKIDSLEKLRKLASVRQLVA